MSGPTPLLELVCLAIVALYVVVRGRADRAPRRFLARLGLLMAASWLAEDTCIRAYGFYGYHPGWSLFIDRVPILIVTIWPMVIHTAWDLARHLAPRRVPLVGALIVLADASLIEPVAVASNLWAWTEPGLFAVPPIGILGWALFTYLALHVLERAERMTNRTPAQLLIFPVTALGVHLALLALWWGALRWVNTTLPPWPFVVIVWVLSLTLAALAYRHRAGRSIPARELLLRVPAAGFFFALLALNGAPLELVAYALAFAPPYLVLTTQALSPASPRSPS